MYTLTDINSVKISDQPLVNSIRLSSETSLLFIFLVANLNNPTYSVLRSITMEAEALNLRIIII